MKKVLITGGAGRFTKELLSALTDIGHEVYFHAFPDADAHLARKVQMEAWDLTTTHSVGDALEGMDIAIHLPGMVFLQDGDLEDSAFATTVLGTRGLVDAIVAQGRKTRLILFSTTATYGDTTHEFPPITTEAAQNPNTPLARAMVEAEQLVIRAGIPYTILRVAPMVPAAPMPAPSWPFVAEQRVEFVYTGDVISALAACVEKEEAMSRILIIAGGLTWQMEGRKFVREFHQALNVPLDDARYAERPLYSDWYDTTEAQRILTYQDTSFPNFLELLTDAVDASEPD